MADSNSKSIAAEGYRQAAISVQKLDGETFIQTNVCPKDRDIISDLGCQLVAIKKASERA